jgi:hypothetical protein
MTRSDGETASSDTIWHPGVPLIVMRIPLTFISRKSVSQIRLELLSNPHNRVTKAPHTAHQFVDRTHQLLSSGSFPASQKIMKHVDHYEHRLFHEENTIRSSICGAGEYSPRLMGESGRGRSAGGQRGDHRVWGALERSEVEVLNPFHPPAPANRSVKRSNWA